MKAHRRLALPLLATWVASLAAGMLLATAPARGADAAPPQERFQQALDAYERNHWPAAFEAFASLADVGNADAARVALLMQRFGPVLYGHRFEVASSRQQHWQAITAEPRATALRAP